jgi:hypothetical protein
MKSFLVGIFISLSLPYAAFASDNSSLINENSIVVPVSVPISSAIKSVVILRKSDFLKEYNSESNSISFIPTKLANGITFETVLLNDTIYALFDDEQYLFVEESNEWGEGFMGDFTCNTVAGATGVIVAAAVPGPAGIVLGVVAGAAAGAACTQYQKTNDTPSNSYGGSGSKQ